jgi:hypothetical protein
MPAVRGNKDRANGFSNGGGSGVPGRGRGAKSRSSRFVLALCAAFLVISLPSIRFDVAATLRVENRCTICPADSPSPASNGATAEPDPAVAKAANCRSCVLKA